MLMGNTYFFRVQKNALKADYELTIIHRNLHVATACNTAQNPQSESYHCESMLYHMQYALTHS